MRENLLVAEASRRLGEVKAADAALDQVIGEARIRRLTDPDRLLDLEPAIAGLPSGVSALRIDGALVVPFDDLNQLGG